MMVIGDNIIDQHIACDALGMSAEAPVIVVKEIEQIEGILEVLRKLLHT